MCVFVVILLAGKGQGVAVAVEQSLSKNIYAGIWIGHDQLPAVAILFEGDEEQDLVNVTAVQPTEVDKDGFLDVLSIEKVEHVRETNLIISHDSPPCGIVLVLSSVRRDCLQIAHAFGHFVLILGFMRLYGTNHTGSQLCEDFSILWQVCPTASDHDADGDGLAIRTRNTGIPRTEPISGEKIITLKLIDVTVYSSLGSPVDNGLHKLGLGVAHRLGVQFRAGDGVELLNVLPDVLRQDRRHAKLNRILRQQLFLVPDAQCDGDYTVPLLLTSDVSPSIPSRSSFAKSSAVRRKAIRRLDQGPF